MGQMTVSEMADSGKRLKHKIRRMPTTVYPRPIDPQTTLDKMFARVTWIKAELMAMGARVETIRMVEMLETDIKSLSAIGPPVPSRQGSEWKAKGVPSFSDPIGPQRPT